MRKEMLAILCVMGLILVGVSTANAGPTITWYMLENVAEGGIAPGLDGLVGTTDDGTGENCNFQPDQVGCADSGTPTRSAYCVNRINWTREEECVAWGLISKGYPCMCNDETTECDPGEDTCPDFEGGCGTVTGKCCAKGTCEPCVDANSYFGQGSLAPGTMTTCLKAGGMDTVTFNVAGTESLPLPPGGGGCLALGTGTEANETTGCGSPVSVTGTISVDAWSGTDCSGDPDFSVPDIEYEGAIFPVGNAPDGETCGYDKTELDALASVVNGHADEKDKTATNMIVLCGQTDLPLQLPLACFPGALVDFLMMAWTDGTIDETTCTGTCE